MILFIIKVGFPYRNGLNSIGLCPIVMKLLEKVSSKPNTSSLTLGGVNYGEYPNRGA